MSEDSKEQSDTSVAIKSSKKLRTECQDVGPSCSPLTGSPDVGSPFVPRVTAPTREDMSSQNVELNNILKIKIKEDRGNTAGCSQEKGMTGSLYIVTERSQLRLMMRSALMIAVNSVCCRNGKSF